MNLLLFGKGADLPAFSAAAAGAPAEHELRLRGKSFRIMTPLTAQRAALEKNGLPYARSVMNGKFLYIKNGS